MSLPGRESGSEFFADEFPENTGERHPDPRILLGRIELFTDEVSRSFKGILGSLERLQEDIKQLDQLKQVAIVAEKMLSGEHTGHVNVEAKGEVGKLVNAINKTLMNLQELDKTVHNETGKVPELAAHLDTITQETEVATQQVLEKLDEVIADSESQATSLQALQVMSRERMEMDREAKKSIDEFLNHLSEGTDQEQVLQEALEFVALMGERARVHLEKSEEVGRAIDVGEEEAQKLMNHAFDIMNMLQFQDITRQKISKVIGLLKDMQSGLYRLLNIFNIHSEDSDRLVLTDYHRATQDRILERDAISRDTHVQSVDQIIENFKNNN